MSIFANLFKKQADADAKVVGNVEDFVSLTRVYFQSVIAVNLGITNIRFLPDVANFKRLFKVATQGGKLGLAEKSASRKMLMQDYGIKLPSLEYEQHHTVNQRRMIYLAVSGKLFAMFQVAYQRDPDTAAVLDSLRHSGLSLIVDCDDFNRPAGGCLQPARRGREGAEHRRA